MLTCHHNYTMKAWNLNHLCGKTYIWVISIGRYYPGESPLASLPASPSGIYLPPPFNQLLSSIAGLANDVWLCLLLQGPQQMGWGLPIFMETSQHLPYSGAIPCCPSDSTRALFPHSLIGVGVTLKDFIVMWPFYWYCLKRVLQKREVYGLAMVWVLLYQARVSTIDDTVRKLILLASSGPNWPYAFVQFNGDPHHMPLPKEGHLSAMTEGTPNNISCGRIHQLEVHQLLHSEAQVVYP